MISNRLFNRGISSTISGTFSLIIVNIATVIRMLLGVIKIKLLRPTAVPLSLMERSQWALNREIDTRTRLQRHEIRIPYIVIPEIA